MELKIKILYYEIFFFELFNASAYMNMLYEYHAYFLHFMYNYSTFYV